ncbi:hypothetical protein BsWGS_22148 [Bradybaena similaris]
MSWAAVSVQMVLMLVQAARCGGREFDASSCLVADDPVYGGNLTDCSGQNLSGVIRLHGLPHNTTTLLLDRTNMRCLHDNFLQGTNLSCLRHLSVQDFSLTTIQVNALRGLQSLDVLNLEHNRLPFCDSSSFPAGMFRHVPNLRHLFIGFNIGYWDTSPDCRTYENITHLFVALPLLTNLTIDAVSGTLKLDPLFSQLTNLTNLTLVCNKVSSISNGSLVELQHLQLKAMRLVAKRRGDTPMETGVFQDLPHLQYLSLSGIHVSNHGILLALEPLSNRRLEAIQLTKTNMFQTYNIPSTVFNDGIIDSDARFLSSICVRHFSWIGSLLFAVKPNTLFRGAWITCLETLDLSQNKLENTGWLSDLWEMVRFKNLREFTISSINSPDSESIPNLLGFDLSDVISGHDARAVSHWKGAVDNNKNFNSSSGLGSVLFHTHDFNKFTRDFNKFTRRSQGSSQEPVTFRRAKTDHYPDPMIFKGSNRHHISETMIYRGGNRDNFWEGQCNRPAGHPDSWAHQRFPYNGNITFYLPASLERLKAINLVFAGITLEHWTVVFAASSKLKELYWVNNQLLRSRGVLYGLEALKVLAFSGSIFDIPDHFFDTVPGLEVLLLDNIQLETLCLAHSLQRLLRNLTHLRYLDISRNELNSLPVTFASTPNISHLILSQNRFSNIPFDIETTGSLRFLDLSSNAILFLSEQEMQTLNRHVAKVGNFTLRLHGNGIACVCSQAAFFVWVHTTPVSLDVRTPYECVTDDLLQVNITGLDDILTFTRMCQGGYFLLAAIILASLMIIVFLTAFLLVRFRTSIEALLLAIFVRAFRPMRPEDYKIQVFIGYAEEDTVFVKHILLKYLEGELKQTTFVHGRDLVGGYTDQQLHDAISNSWRVLLVLSKNFLTSYSMAHIVMKYASHSVTAVNRRRLFVLLEETQLHAIPDYLQPLLDQDSVVLVRDLGQPLTYQHEMAIRGCLRPPQ